MTSLEIEHLHSATLGILEEIGVRLEHDQILARLFKAGARPGAKAQEVRFPPAMVKEYLALAPPKVELGARNGTATLLAASSTSVFWTNPAMYLWTGSARREIESTDLARIARLCDHLENTQGVLGVAMRDVPPRHSDFVGLRVIAENCRKHARVLCFTPCGAEALVEMKRCFDGPWFSIGFTAHGPLRWTHLALDIFAKTAGHGIPATINGEPMAGVTGPVSLAGTIAIGNAEILAGIIVNQVLEPGRPLIYNLGLAHIMDNEMIAYARRYQRGFKVTADELQFDLIREVGITGSFLDTEHTLAHFREAFYQPAILNRAPRDRCRGPLPEVARQRAEEIIARDREEKISADALTELKRIEDRFRLT